MIAEVCSLADGGHVTWAIDLNSGGAALVLTLLANHDQLVFYIPGRIIHHAAATYRGDAKTDAKEGLSSFLCEVVRFLVVGEVDATGKRDREYV